MISGAFDRLCSFLTCQQQLPPVLDTARASLYAFSRWLDGKMGTKISSQPAQLKTKFLSLGIRTDFILGMGKVELKVVTMLNIDQVLNEPGDGRCFRAWQDPLETHSLKGQTTRERVTEQLT